MKKIILALSIFLLAGISFNFKSYAGCEASLPNSLQSCFNSIQLNAIQVVVSGGVATVTGPITLLNTAPALACVDEYNAGAASCPGAPTLWFVLSTASTSGGPSSGRPTTPVVR